MGIEEKLRSKRVLMVAAIFAIIVLVVVSHFFGNFSASAVRVLDTRISFQFTAYPDKEEHFVAYSLENTKKKKVKAAVRVHLGATGSTGIFQLLEQARDEAVLEPLETKAFVTKIELPKSKVPKSKDLSAKVKVKRVSRA